jgi:hypothetical protein
VAGVFLRRRIVPDFEIRWQHERRVGEEPIPTARWQWTEDQGVSLPFNCHGLCLQAQFDRNTDCLVPAVAKDSCDQRCHKSLGSMSLQNRPPRAICRCPRGSGPRTLGACAAGTQPQGRQGQQSQQRTKSDVQASALSCPWCPWRPCCPCWVFLPPRGAAFRPPRQVATYPPASPSRCRPGPST